MNRRQFILKSGLALAVLAVPKTVLASPRLGGFDQLIVDCDDSAIITYESLCQGLSEMIGVELPLDKQFDLTFGESGEVVLEVGGPLSGFIMVEA